MKANDIILLSRKRLGDVEHPLRWSDEELTDAINSALSAITTELNPFTAEWIVTLIPDKTKYELPPYFHRLIDIKVDGKSIKQENIRGFEWVQKHMGDYVDKEMVASVDLHHLYLFPVDESTKEAVVTYNYEEQIAYKTDTINLPERFRDAILFYVLHLAHQSPVRSDGENKTVYYMNLFEKQIDKLKAMVYANKHSRKIQSNYNRV